MTKRNRLRSARPKALFGLDGAVTGAATLAAAGINAAATNAAALIQANAAKKSAREQSAAIRANAERQADALKLQNENANQLQEKMIAFNKEQNDRIMQQYKDIALQSQIQAGQQNQIAAREAGKIQLKRGGSIRRGLRNIASFLRGRNNNLPFTVTDGGGVIPVATTPEGYDLYEIVGNDHEHYHKAQGGKSKTGVGIKFAGSETIEGEGNQGSSQGELMLVTPDDAKFISKHTLKGFNPAKAVMSGVHPLEAFAEQEAIKDTYGLSDDGKYESSTPVRRMHTYGGVPNFNTNLQFLIPPMNTIVDNNRYEAKCGRSLKKCGGRKKAPNGLNLKPIETPNCISYLYPDSGVTTYLRTTPSTTSYYPNDSNNSNNTIGGYDYNKTARGNLWGAGITALGNFGGALITNIGNNRASRILTQGYDDAAGILTDAYGRLSGVDMNLLDRSNFRSAHAMAALQAPIVNVGAQRAAAERALHRNLRSISRGTLSSAAAQNRMARANSDYNDQIGQIEENRNKAVQYIIQGNMNRITTVANENANRDTQAIQDFGRSYLDLLKYNNDIKNEAITGAAQAQADAALNKASTIAGTKQSNAASWAGATSTSLSGFGNTLATNAKMAHELDMSRYGWSAENNLNWTIRNNDLNEARMLYKRYKGAGGQYDIWATQLENVFGINKLKS